MPSLSQEKLLAQGRTSEIYAWRTGWVLKLFRERFPEQDVEYEARIARAVQSVGMRVPEVGKIERVEGRLGLEYERLEGISLWDELKAKPWMLPKGASLLARLHGEIHSTLGPAGIPWLKDKLERRVRDASELRNDVREALLERLSGLPHGRHLLHGDFNPDNIVVTDHGPVVIDWIDASVGSPPADVARTSILSLGEQSVPGHMSFLERAALALGHRAYRKRYFRRRPGGEQEYRAWMPIVAAARLSEGIEELTPWLVRQAELVTSHDLE